MQFHAIRCDLMQFDATYCSIDIASIIVNICNYKHVFFAHTVFQSFPSFKLFFSVRHSVRTTHLGLLLQLLMLLCYCYCCPRTLSLSLSLFHRSLALGRYRVLSVHNSKKERKKERQDFDYYSPK